MVDHLDQMQVSEPRNGVEPSNFPDSLQFGHVHLTNNFQMFLEAIEYAIDSHQQVDIDTTAMNARQLLAFLKRELDEDDPAVPRYWHIGSLIGEVIGFLFPTLDRNNPSHTHLEALSLRFRESAG
jgi:hypothetical protein